MKRILYEAVIIGMMVSSGVLFTACSTDTFESSVEIQSIEVSSDETSSETREDDSSGDSSTESEKSLSGENTGDFSSSQYENVEPMEPISSQQEQLSNDNEGGSSSSKYGIVEPMEPTQSGPLSSSSMAESKSSPDTRKRTFSSGEDEYVYSFVQEPPNDAIQYRQNINPDSPDYRRIQMYDPSIKEYRYNNFFFGENYYSYSFTNPKEKDPLSDETTYYRQYLKEKDPNYCRVDKWDPETKLYGFLTEWPEPITDWEEWIREWEEKDNPAK